MNMNNTGNNRRRSVVVTTKRRLFFFFSSTVGSFACICSDTSCASAFQISGLTSLLRSSYTPRKLTAREEQSRNNKSRLFVTNYSREEEQQYQISEEDEIYFEQQYGWDNDDDDASWFPITDSILDEYVNNIIQMEKGGANGEEVKPHYTLENMQPTSTEKLLDSLKPTPIDSVSSQDIEEQFLRMVSNEVEYKKLLGKSPYALTDIKFPALLQRFLDTIEDSSQKNNGKLKGQSKRRGRDQPREERKTVVVLGTGWASHAFIKLASTYDLRIVVVSPVNHFVFT